MPFAEDFDAAAAVFEAAALASENMVAPARSAFGTGVMVGGQLTDMVTSELDAADILLRQVTTELTEMAVLCRERAEICRQSLAAGTEFSALTAEYRTELAQWEAGGKVGREPQPPTAPTDPPPWANV